MASRQAPAARRPALPPPRAARRHAGRGAPGRPPARGPAAAGAGRAGAGARSSGRRTARRATTSRSPAARPSASRPPSGTARWTSTDDGARRRGARRRARPAPRPGGRAGRRRRAPAVATPRPPATSSRRRAPGRSAARPSRRCSTCWAAVRPAVPRGAGGSPVVVGDPRRSRRPAPGHRRRARWERVGHAPPPPRRRRPRRRRPARRARLSRRSRARFERHDRHVQVRGRQRRLRPRPHLDDRSGVGRRAGDHYGRVVLGRRPGRLAGRKPGRVPALPRGVAACRIAAVDIGGGSVTNLTAGTLDEISPPSPPTAASSSSRGRIPPAGST